MLKNLFIINLVFASFALLSCNSVISQNSETEIKSETPQPRKEAIPKQQKVEFKGVSFTYNPQIFGEVKLEEVAESPLLNETDKPGEDFPKHSEFHFEQLDSINRPIDKGRIVVIPIENYRKMYALSTQLVKGFDENLKNLQKALVNKDFRDNGEIPFMPFYDAHQEFLAKVEHISFQKGKSICFLTQYAQETNLINNEDIRYYCQGITNDGTNYVLAEFPVNVSFLPKDFYVKEFEDYQLPEITWNMNKNELKQYENYISKITKRLENLPSDKYDPNLSYFQEIISSLKIEK